MAKRRKQGTGTIRQRKDGRWEDGRSSAMTKEDFPKPKVSWPKPNGSVRKS